MENLIEAKKSLKNDNFNMADDEAHNLFIDEAVELLQNMDINLPKWIDSPNDIGILAGIRRSFRTLNTSSRAVGAHSVGEMAWSVEKLLNGVVDAEIEVSDVLVQFVNDTKYKIPYLINDFANADLPSIDIAEVVLKSENLKRGRDITNGFEDKPIEDKPINVTESTTDDSTNTLTSESDTDNEKLTLNLSENNSADNEGVQEQVVTNEEPVDTQKKSETSDEAEVNTHSSKPENTTSDSDNSLAKNGLFSDKAFNDKSKNIGNPKKNKSKKAEPSDSKPEESEVSAAESADTNSHESDKNIDSDKTDSDDKSPASDTNDSQDKNEALKDDSKALDDKHDIKQDNTDDTDSDVDKETDEDLIAKTNSKLKKETTQARVENPDYKKSLSNVTLESSKTVDKESSSKSLVWVTIGVILFMIALGAYLVQPR